MKLQKKSVLPQGVRFFRVISGFMAQFGIHGDPKVSAEWKEKKLKDDPVKKSNMRGFLSFATSGKVLVRESNRFVNVVYLRMYTGPDTRTTQIFINFGDNSNLDRFHRSAASPLSC